MNLLSKLANTGKLTNNEYKKRELTIIFVSIIRLKTTSWTSVPRSKFLSLLKAIVLKQLGGRAEHSKSSENSKYIV